MMKKTMVILALVSITGLATAQTNNNQADRAAKREQINNMSPDERARHEAKKMTEKLSLTADQAQSWENAARDRHIANEPLKQKMQESTTPEERKELREKMKRNRADFDKKVNEFLTAEQKQKLQEQKKARHSGKKRHHDEKPMTK